MKNIYVGNLNVSAKEDMLRLLFEKYGTVERVNIVTDHDTGKPRGFGFVEMTNDAEGLKATLSNARADVRERQCRRAAS